MRKLIISILIGIVLTSCKVQSTAMQTEGRILYAEEDRVFVVFKDAFIRNRYYAEWFYFPNHGQIDINNYTIIVSLSEIPK